MFFRSQNTMMGVSYAASSDTFRADKPKPWSPAHITGRMAVRSFDLHPDGKRFAVLMPHGRVETAKLDKVTFIFNFFDEWRRHCSANKAIGCYVYATNLARAIASQLGNGGACA